MNPLPLRRFDALAGYSRSPLMGLSARELSWFEESDERLLGLVSIDLADRDYVYTVLARDAHGRFRAFDLAINLPTEREATDRLAMAMRELAGQPDDYFHQGDEAGRLVDLFTLVVPAGRVHPSFHALTEQAGYSPALGLLRELMHHYQDVDGNLAQQFQSDGFDARLWELYLFALFTELGYGFDRTHPAPDFHCRGLGGEFFVEATTVNPSASPPEVDERAEEAYYVHYVPAKYGSALFSKLKKRYWERPHCAEAPLVLAVQDFHAPQAMAWSNSALVEYLYGIRQVETAGPAGQGTVTSEPVDWYEWRGKRVPAGFFRQPDTGHIAAVLANPGGTLSKFNRMGFLAGFGDRSLKMVRGGIRYRAGRTTPESYAQEVHAPGYSETWREGVSVFHNPNARRPLPEDCLPGVAHHSATDGRIVASMPDGFPVGTQTYILVPDTDANG